MAKLFQRLRQICLIMSNFGEARNFQNLFKERLWTGLRLTDKKRHTVSVAISPDGDYLEVILQRPIEPSDIKNGKLIPTALCEIVRRGGKMKTSLALSSDTAQALHKILGRALRDAEAKQAQKEFESKMYFFVIANGVKL